MYLICLSKIVSILQLLYDFIKKNVYEFSCNEACKYIDALKDSMYFLGLLTLYKLKKTVRVIFEFFVKVHCQHQVKNYVWRIFYFKAAL